MLWIKTFKQTKKKNHKRKTGDKEKNNNHKLSHIGKHRIDNFNLNKLLINLLFKHSNIIWMGTRHSQVWKTFLKKKKFLVDDLYIEIGTYHSLHPSIFVFSFVSIPNILIIIFFFFGTNSFCIICFSFYFHNLFM